MQQNNRRVVITGAGIVSCLGNELDPVSQALKDGVSGISHQETFQARGLRSHIAGAPNIDIDAHIDRKVRRFMGDGAAYAYIAMDRAIKDAGLEYDDISAPNIGLIAGSGGSSSEHQVLAADLLREKGAKRVGPYMVPRTMASTISACLATPFKIKGLNYSIVSACATSSHCIGHAAEQIQLGKQDMIFAGGGEELHWTLACMFDGMGALSSKFNDAPHQASRPYDTRRDGFVIAGGAGMVVVEALDSALARNAKIYAEITGFGATSDGVDMVAPSGDGAVRCMEMALQGQTDSVDYINAHGTSTPVGDISELKAIKQLFSGSTKQPYISSTKSQTGHSLGATGVQEIIFSLLMMRDRFISGSINIDELAADAEGLNIVTKTIADQPIDCFLSNSFGFGGTNASLLLKRYMG